MKKSASLEQSRVPQPRASSDGRRPASSVVTAEGVKLLPAEEGEQIGLQEEYFPNSEAYAVSLAYFNPAAREVLVAGSFNEWQPRSTPMNNQGGGEWSTELLLKPGHYEYRFVVDGQWQDDSLAERLVANPFGGLNCVIEVKPPATAAPANRP